MVIAERLTGKNNMPYLKRSMAGPEEVVPCLRAKDFEVLPLGIRLRSERSYDIGVELALNLRTPDGDTMVSGFVVECVAAPDEPGCYDLVAYVASMSGGSPLRDGFRRRNGTSVI